MSLVAVGQKSDAICPKWVRYIKLGRGGKWEADCVKENIIRFGFNSARDDRFKLCCNKQWDLLKESFIEDGKDRGTAERFKNEVSQFFSDEGSTLWITFFGELLYWGFVDSESSPKQHEDGRSVYRQIANGWRWHDLNGEPLTKNRLSGALTKLAGYRGTSCNVDVRDYVVDRINGKKVSEVEDALKALEEMRKAVRGLIRLLDPRDFETLVDLVFSTSGWRRQGRVGGTQKTLDIDLLLPSTGERAFVQVKSDTTSAELTEYVRRIDELGPYDRMFYVFHKGEASTDDDRVTVIGPEKLVELVLDEGLTNWLIRKVE
jgi:hypothetical protein